MQTNKTPSLQGKSKEISKISFEKYQIKEAYTGPVVQNGNTISFCFFPQELPRHDKVPNLKLVMNPEGKLHDWTDLPPEELPEMQVLRGGGELEKSIFIWLGSRGKERPFLAPFAAFPTQFRKKIDSEKKY